MGVHLGYHLGPGFFTIGDTCYYFCPFFFEDGAIIWDRDPLQLRIPVITFARFSLSMGM
jgi:hypothetical protein